MRILQERIAVAGSPDHQFALIHLVEGLSIEEWLRAADVHNIHGWLALPMDKEEGMPLYALRTVLEELVHQRDHDTLTGLGNRRFFDRTISFELQRAARTGTPLSLVMIDLDHFKDVNDTHGHATGDAVLVGLGELLSRSLRVYDLAARIGGEEFCLILPGASLRQAEELAERILDEFRGMTFEAPEGGVFSVTFSAGVVTVMGRKNLPDAKTLLNDADALLYEAKRQGRNRVVTMRSEQKVSENPTLVQAEEKQFLFTGKHPQ